MLRLLSLLLVFSPYTTCQQQTSYIGIYGSSANSAQYSSGQYICNTCQTSSNNVQSQYSTPQFQCNSCQYSPGVQATTTMSPSNLAQCTCNNCQQQGAQFSCASCQSNMGASGYGYGSTASPMVNQQFRDPGLSQQNYGYSSGSSYGNQRYTGYYDSTVAPYNGFSNTVSPYGNQQYQNPSGYGNPYSASQQGYNSQNYGYSTTMSPYSNQQGLQYNPSQQYNNGFSSTASPYGSQQYQESYNGQNYGNQPLRDSGLSQQNYGYSTTMSPYGSQQQFTGYYDPGNNAQQYQNPSGYGDQYSASQQSYNGQNYGYSTTMPPYTNLQYNPSQQGGQYNNGFSTTMSPYGSQQYQNTGYGGGFSTTMSSNQQQFNDQAQGGSPTLRYNELTNTNLGYPSGYSSNAPGSQPLFDQSSASQNNDGTYVSGQYLPGVQGRVYDSRVGLTQFNTQVKRK